MNIKYNYKLVANLMQENTEVKILKSYDGLQNKTKKCLNNTMITN